MNNDLDAQVFARQAERSEEAASEAVPFIIAQYSALREEILKRSEFRYQLISLTLIVAGTLLTVGLQPNVSASVLFVYPILALFLAGVWIHNVLVPLEIGDYISERLEARVFPLGWETFRKSCITRRWLLGVVSTSGIFISTQLIAFVLGLLRSTYTVIETILLVSDIIAIVLTLIILRSAREVLR